MIVFLTNHQRIGAHYSRPYIPFTPRENLIASPIWYVVHLLPLNTKLMILS